MTLAEIFREEGREEIRKIFMEKGFEKGFKEGFEKGRMKYKKEAAEKLIAKGFSFDEAVDLIGLSAKEYEKIY